MRQLPFTTVVYTQDFHPPGHVSFAETHGMQPFTTKKLCNGSEQMLWPTHCVQGTYGAEFHAALGLPNNDSGNNTTTSDADTAVNASTAVNDANGNDSLIALPPLAVFCPRHAQSHERQHQQQQQQQQQLQQQQRHDDEDGSDHKTSRSTSQCEYSSLPRVTTAEVCCVNVSAKKIELAHSVVVRKGLLQHVDSYRYDG